MEKNEKQASAVDGIALSHEHDQIYTAKAFLHDRKLNKRQVQN